MLMESDVDATGSKHELHLREVDCTVREFSIEHMPRKGCKDDRDRAYGMMAMMSSDSQIKMAPDHTKTVAQVYRVCNEIRCLQNAVPCRP
jgi:hypothetical protein